MKNLVFCLLNFDRLYYFCRWIMSGSDSYNSTGSQSDDKDLIEAFGLEQSEVFEARYNLLGFYGTLQKIKWRLEKEDKL